MELKEVVIIFVNAIATTFGFSGPLYSIYLALTKERFTYNKYMQFYAVLYIFDIITEFAALTYLPLVLTVVSFIYLLIKKIGILHNTVMCLSAVSIFFILMALNNIIVLAMNIPAEKVIELRDTVYYNVYNSILFTISTCIAIFIINILSKRIQKVSIFRNETYGNNRLIVFVVGSIMFYVAVISTIWFVAMVDTHNGLFYTVYTVILSVLLGLFVGFSLYTTIKIVSQKKYELETKHNKEITELYKQEIQSMYENMRDFKHDYMKIYSSMSVLFEQDRYDELKRFFYSEIMPLQKKMLSESVADSGVTMLEDVIIQGTIYNYVVKSRSKGIDLKLDINEKIPTTTGAINSLDLVRILGILLDNAFDAVSGKKQGERIVRFGVILNGSRLIFIVKNKYTIKPDMSKIFTKGYSTKGGEHGRGLAIVKRITDKYDDVFLNVKLEKEYFVTELNLQIV